MNDKDYVILFDQNGSPYIVHASLSAMRQRSAGALRAVGNAANTAREGVGRGVRATHKYIDKVVENGKTRYFYTQEELKAYYNEQRGKVNQKVGEAQEKASATRMRMERMGNEFKDKASNTVQSAKRYGEAVKNYNELSKKDGADRKEAFSKLMSTEEGRKLRETHIKVWDKMDETALKAASHLKGAKEYDTWKKANREYHDDQQSAEKKAAADKAWDSYSKTPHYKFLNDNFVANAQTNGLKDAVSDSVQNAKDKASDAKKAVKETADSIKDKANEITSNAKEGAAKAKEELIQNLKDHGGSPSNTAGETRSMLGSYATEIPSSPDKLKDWADKGKEQAQQIMKEAEQALKEIQQGYENGEYTQYQMWTAQNIVNGMRDEMSEWEFLSGMSGDDLAQLFRPLLKAKK